MSQAAIIPKKDQSTVHDALVFGAGFYGCSIALRLRQSGLSVLVLEREHAPMLRASMANQARVHAGYHYPRDYTTAWRSAESMQRFVTRYRRAVVDNFTQLYAVASRGSHVSAGQFGSMMRSVGAPLKGASRMHASLFSRNLVDSIYETQEYAFDSVALAGLIMQEALDAGVEFRFGLEVLSVREDTENVTIETSEGSHSGLQAFNCTYGRLHALHPVPLVRSIKYQVCELCLVKPPPILQDVGITIMDGPFWSCMPWPGRGLHSLSHVRHTPRISWVAQDQPDRDPYLEVDVARNEGSAFRAMLDDAARFVPAMADAAHVDSLWEVKAVLSASAVSDGRPILLERSPGGRVSSVLGGKLDNVFDVLDALDLRDGGNLRESP